MGGPCRDDNLVFFQCRLGWQERAFIGSENGGGCKGEEAQNSDMHLSPDSLDIENLSTPSMPRISSGKHHPNGNDSYHGNDILLREWLVLSVYQSQNRCRGYMLDYKSRNVE